jgi:kumamolisin
LVGAEQGTESPTLSQAFDEATLEMGTQGQSAFASSGDQGPFEANSPFDEETTNLTTLTPASSPYITAAGGTTLAGTQSYDVLDQNGTPTGALQSVTIPKERTWSWDYQWPLFATLTGGTSEDQVATSFGLDDGSGGGYSVLEPEPSYQRGVRGVTRDSAVHYLTPTTVRDDLGIPLPTAFAFDPSPTISTSAAPAGRVTPDLAFDADPETGYAVYDPQFGPVYGSDIQMFGGTSIVAPQLNGATAVLASSLGHRLGFWNPVIYAAAQSDHSPFTPLSDNQIYGSSYFSQTNADGSTSPLAGSFSNNNLYYTGTPGTIYNPASGLGFADLADLGPFFTH